ncbi:endo alpha-1,4 polygalactosaminidase [Aureibaculum luteum]|uniref:endo alpha-1,4 polygalactosaminidase n=1 Tax=Aureibaculum luteum TaxID=1548456 RepID=UPI000E552F62|nr:endo alpha-1,4 polygalactosaminidase [Aureibaculum luteum]
MKYYHLIALIFILYSCNSDSKVDEPINSDAIPIYNQAYQENYAEDTIDYIKNNAENGYVLLDPFQDDVIEHIEDIKAKNNQVGAYISIGTGETYRDDYNQMQAYLVSTPWGEWPDEFFVKSTTSGILEVMKARIDKIAAWGFDWVEFDNMDWFYDDELRTAYGVEVTENEGIDYYQKLCSYVHSKGMKCMAKNRVENASDFDGVLYESYNDDKNWWDQSGAQSFLDAGKLVIINHYNESNCGQVYFEYKGI